MLKSCNFFLKSNEIKFTVEQTLLSKHIEWDNISIMREKNIIYTYLRYLLSF